MSTPLAWIGYIWLSLIGDFNPRILLQSTSGDADIYYVYLSQDDGHYLRCKAIALAALKNDQFPDEYFIAQQLKDHFDDDVLGVLGGLSFDLVYQTKTEIDFEELVDEGAVNDAYKEYLEDEFDFDTPSEAEEFLLEREWVDDWMQNNEGLLTEDQKSLLEDLWLSDDEREAQNDLSRLLFERMEKVLNGK